MGRHTRVLGITFPNPQRAEEGSAIHAGRGAYGADNPRHRVDTPPMSEWAEARRGYMTAATVAMNAKLHAADTAYLAPQSRGEGTPFAGWSAPGVAL